MGPIAAGFPALWRSTRLVGCPEKATSATPESPFEPTGAVGVGLGVGHGPITFSPSLPIEVGFAPKRGLPQAF